jgi:uncharacterized protein (TIGR03086 family)
MLERRAFARAARALEAVVDRLDDDQWSMRVPEALRWTGTIHTLRDLVAHHAQDEAWVPDVLSGSAAAELGDRHAGDLLGDDPRASYARLVAHAIAAVDALDDLDRQVELSYGRFSAREYLLHITIFRGLGAFEIDVLVGGDGTLPDALVDDLLELIAPHAAALRELGVFAPEIEVPRDAAPQLRLLALVGRASPGEGQD